MTCACMETGRERRDLKIPSSTLAFGQSELYSCYFLNLGSGFVLRSPVIGKGISVRTSSQKWPSWTGWGNANTGSRLAPSLPTAIMVITEAFIFTAIYEPLWRQLPLGLLGSGDNLRKGTEQRCCGLPEVIISLAELCLLPLLR